MSGQRYEKAEKQIVFSYHDIKSKNFPCVQCKRQFFIKENNFSKKDSHVPLLLPCGHTICDYCHHANYNLSCNACEQPQLKSDNNEKPKLPIDVYTLGVVTLSHNRPVNLADPDLKFYQTTSSKIRQSLSQDRCSECMNRAVSKCVECNVLLCNSCHAKLHGRALENHRKVMISNSQSAADVSSYTKCATHNQKPFSFYCQVCDVVVCSDCLLELHNGHTVESLSSRNENLKEKFHSAYQNIAETLQRVHQTQKSVERHLQFPDQLQNSDMVEANINQYFAHIHGVLQQIERELIEKMNSQRSALRNHMEKIKKDINEYEEILQDNLLMAASVKNSLPEMDLLSLIKKLKNVANLPCHLIKQPVVSDQRVRFEADKTIVDILKNHCSITVPKIVPFSLVNSDNLPSNHTLEPINLKDIPSLWEDEEKERPPSPTPSIATSTSSIKSNRLYEDSLVKGGCVMVRVTHIIDPSFFYVQQAHLLSEVEAFNKQLCEYVSKSDQSPKEILIGSLYIVKYMNSWYRGRVLKFQKNQQGEERYEIFYIDYGNLQSVSIQDIRYISQQFSTQPAYAIKCSLYDIVPKGEKWNMTANATMQRFIKENVVPSAMSIFDIVDNTYFVDLEINTIDRKLTLRDNLLMTGLGTYTNSRTLKIINPSSVRKFFHQDLKISKFSNAMCSYVESPDSIYIVLINNSTEKYKEMRNEMKTEYKKGKSRKHFIQSPEKGMPCAALYTDNYWYRAIICDDPCAQTVEVFFVDVGKKAILSFDKIRKIQQKFMYLATQAIHLSLQDVAPTSVGSTKWNECSIEFLKNFLYNAKVKVFPHSENKINPFYKSYSVSMYLLDENKTNVNVLLVSSNFAISTGISSEIVAPKVRKNKTNLVQSKKSNYGGSIASETKRSEKVVDELEPYRLRIVVLNAKSPDCIYVADPMKEQMNNILQAEMQLFYNKHISAISEIEWQKDQMCAVYSRKDKAFVRAKILNVLSETELSVLLIDFGLEETVLKDDVQPLDKSLLSTPRYQFKIKLADIIAPGGTGSWPSSSCQKLREIINENENFRFYITKVAETVDEVIPAELWMKVSKLDDPFGSDKIEMQSVSRLLTEVGLAIPIKNYSQAITRALAMDVQKQLDKSEQNCENDFGEISWTKINSRENTLVNSDNSTYNDDVESNSDSYSQSESQEKNLKWIPAAKIHKDAFRATATNVDTKCHIYLHPVEQNETIKKIENNLDQKYSGKQRKSYNHKWNVGDICAAQYHNNQKWYRAQIKNIEEDNVLVEFIDYGNTEDCEITAIRKINILQNIPIQYTKCIVHSFRPDNPKGIWPTPYLDKIHCLLVDKEFDVNVIKRTGSSPEILHVSITLLQPKYCDLVTYVYKEMQLNIRDPKEIFSESEESSSEKNTSLTTVNNDHVDDVLIEGFLTNCQDYPNAGLEYESELLRTFTKDSEMSCKKSNSNAGSDRGSEFESEFPTLNTSTRDKCTKSTVGIASSLESLSWHNLVKNDSRMTTSTPQVELNNSEVNSEISDNTVSSSIEESSEDNIFPDILNLLKNDEFIRLEMSTITKKGLKKNEVEFLGHITGGNKNIYKVVGRYNQMDREIQKIASSQPFIQEPKIYMPCFALYTDNNWYRGLITKYEGCSEKWSITVKYIDFGNSAVKDINELRQMDDKWKSVPRMAVNCKVYNLVPKYGHSKTEFAQKVVNYYENKTLYAKIKECHNRIITVELFFDNKCTQPALLPLIKEDLFSPKV